MAEIAESLGMARTITLLGRTLKIGGRPFVVEGAFEVWLEEQAADAIERHKRRMAPNVYAEHLRGWRQDCAAHAYSFAGPIGMAAALTQPAGMKKLAWLQLCYHNTDQEVSEELVAKVYDSPDDWDRLITAMWAEDQVAEGPEGNAPAQTTTK